MIHYTSIGNGKPVLMLHGFPNDSEAWFGIAPALIDRYKLILPDLPGAGQSPLSTDDLNLTYMAQCLNSILEREQIEKVILVGHSMGGYTALEFAQLFPHKVAGVSLVHSLASADNAAKKETRRKSIALMQKGELEKTVFLKGMAQNLFAKHFANKHPEAITQVVENGNKLSVTVLCNFYKAIMERTDKTEMLKTVPFPIQWIIGDEDVATPMTEALQQCHLAPVNSVHIYENCGHMAFIEMPERLTKDLVSFFEYCINSSHIF